MWTDGLTDARGWLNTVGDARQGQYWVIHRPWGNNLNNIVMPHALGRVASDKILKFVPIGCHGYQSFKRTLIFLTILTG